MWYTTVRKTIRYGRPDRSGPKALWTAKGTINCTEMTTVPAGYRLKVVGDYYYDGTGDFRVQIVKK